MRSIVPLLLIALTLLACGRVETPKDTERAEQPIETPKRAEQADKPKLRAAGNVDFDKPLSFDDYIDFAVAWQIKKRAVQTNEIARNDTQREYTNELSKWTGKEVGGKLVFVKLQICSENILIHFGHERVENGLQTLFIGMLPKNRASEVSAFRIGDDTKVRSTFVSVEQPGLAMVSIMKIEKAR